jgi:hypothetical protein
MGLGPRALEVLDMTPEFWRRRRVFITGHTGFKGGWLALWLAELGAEVHGYALEPPTTPNLFKVARLAECLSGHVIGDVRDPPALNRATPGRWSRSCAGCANALRDVGNPIPIRGRANRCDWISTALRRAPGLAGVRAGV